MSEKSFFEMSSKQGMIMGLALGIAVVSTIGFFVLLAGQPADNNNGGTNSNTNANTNIAPTPTPSPAAGDVSKLAPILDSAYAQGPKNAKVTIIEVSDFQCPYCKRHNPTMEQIMEEYDGQVRRVWVHFPLTSIHPYATKASEAAECAGEQGKFWEMHDIIFENQTAMTVDDLKSYAKNIGLNASDFDTCLDDGRYTSKVQQNMQAAQAAGITGTPGTFINGQLIKGAYPFDTFKAVIDAELAK